MDVETARTFLEVVEAGSFVGAAERLNVTQSTVSMRIKQLEGTLGRSLFTRGKRGAELTAAGVQFRRHAAAMLGIWQQARHDVAVPPDHVALLNVAGQLSLWERLLIRWIAAMRREHADVALRAVVGEPPAMVRHVAEGILDIAVMYTPQSRPGLVVERLFDDTLVLVTTGAADAPLTARDYVYVDWGPDFQDAHREAFSWLDMPGLFIGLGVLGLRYMLDYGGAGYFPARVVRPLLESGRLNLVAGAPEFLRPAYAVYRTGEAEDTVGGPALVAMRRIAAEAAEPLETPA